MKKITVTIASKSHEGNIYAILGKVSQAMKRERLIVAFNNLRDDVLNSSSYQEAIARIRQDIDLIDTDKLI